VGKIKLIDYIHVDPDVSLTSLSKKEKVKLMDHMFSEGEGKGLSITYDLSHSGRRINNRIYTTRGQKDGIPSLLSPYPKPILVHHDEGSDPIGRFTNGEWEDLSNQAMSHFDNVNNFLEVKRAYDKDSPEEIYSVMKKYNLLTNKNWPGLGRMRVNAKISDEKAIEKFLDGRYITFSAGSTTDRHVCSICQSDWAEGDICEHRHGKIYDGEICVFITGTFEVLEGSVVNMPADDLSQVLSMELTDLNERIESFDNNTIDKETIYLSDSIYNITERIMENGIQEPVLKTEENSDTISTDSVSVTSETVNDTNEVDEVSAVEDTKEEVVEDLEDSSEIEVEKEVDVSEETNNTDEEVVSLIKNSNLLELIIEKLQSEVNSDESQNEEIEESVESKDSIDWYVLDAALQHELGEARLSKEQREKLNDSFFCGPERSFPIADNDHVIVAKELVAKIKLSEDQRSKMLELIDEKASMLPSSSLEELDDKYQALKQDYEKSLNKIEVLKKSLDNLSKMLIVKMNIEDSYSDLDERIEGIVKWLGNEKEELVTVDSLENSLENPSIANSNDSIVTKNALGSFEQSVITKYNTIRETDGNDAAERYLFNKRRYLPRGFHPTKFN